MIKPILFNTDMVRALLEGRKTVTRRVVKPQPICYGPDATFEPHDEDFFLSAEKNWLRCRVCGNDPEYSREGSNVSHHWKPPYRIGYILYVRETWCKTDCFGLQNGYVYKANDNSILSETGFIPKWHPSIHMLREAARIFLRVTGVRAERLHNMTVNDSLKEGVKLHAKGVAAGKDPLAPFAQVWNSTIKKADRALYGWEANPWCWVIEFERCEKTGEM